jgi:hypothetical protein
MGAVCITYAAPVHRGRVVARVASESRTCAGCVHAERTATNRGVAPAPEDACRRGSSRAPPPRLGEECLLKMVAGTFPALDRPQRGVGIGRCRDPVREFRTARRPITFAATPCVKGHDCRYLEGFGYSVIARIVLNPCKAAFLVPNGRVEAALIRDNYRTHTGTVMIVRQCR